VVNKGDTHNTDSPSFRFSYENKFVKFFKSKPDLPPGMSPTDATPPASKQAGSIPGCPASEGTGGLSKTAKRNMKRKEKRKQQQQQVGGEEEEEEEEEDDDDDFDAEVESARSGLEAASLSEPRGAKGPASLSEPHGAKGPAATGPAAEEPRGAKGPASLSEPRGAKGPAATGPAAEEPSAAGETAKKIKNLRKKLRQIEELQQKVDSGEIREPSKDQQEKLGRAAGLREELQQLEP